MINQIQPSPQINKNDGVTYNYRYIWLISLSAALGGFLRIRGTAMSITAMSLWIGNFTLTFSFPSIKENFGWANNFWLYGAICVVGFVVLYFKLPETNGKTLEEIEMKLVD